MRMVCARVAFRNSLELTMRIRVLAFIFIGAIPAALCSEPNAVLTLPEALALAVMHNPELAAYSWEIRAADARALQAGLRPNPELGVEVEEAGGTGSRRGLDSAETTIQLSQLIERGGKRAKRKQAAELEKKLAHWDYQSKRLDVLARTTKAFNSVLAAQENLDLTAKLLALSQQQADAVRQRVEAGKDMPLERNKAEVVYSQVRIQHRQAQSLLQDARRQLASAWNQKEPVFEKVRGELDEIGQLPAFNELAQQVGQNPDLERWQAEIELAKAQEALERALGKQDFTVSAGMQRFNETDDNAVVFGISIPLPVFDRNQGNIAAARFQTRKLQEQQKAAQARVHAELSEAYAALAGAHAEASETKECILQNAKQAFENAQEAWRQGKIDTLNVLDAQRTFFETQTQYIESLAAFHEAHADVRRLIGSMPTTEITDYANVAD